MNQGSGLTIDKINKLIVASIKPKFSQSQSVKFLSTFNSENKHQQHEQVFKKAWRDFDVKKLGALDKVQSFNLVSSVLKQIKGDKNYCVTDFDQWFDAMDPQKLGIIDKQVILDYITKQIAQNNNVASSNLISKSQIQKGIANLKKLVDIKKNQHLDYLTIHDLVKKIFICFDFDADLLLNKKEIHILAEHTLREFQKNDASMNLNNLREKFKQLELCGDPITDKQLIIIMCQAFNVQQPDKNEKLNDIPSPLVRKSASASRLVTKSSQIASKSSQQNFQGKILDHL